VASKLAAVPSHKVVGVVRKMGGGGRRYEKPERDSLLASTLLGRMTNEGRLGSVTTQKNKGGSSRNHSIGGKV